MSQPSVAAFPLHSSPTAIPFDTQASAANLERGSLSSVMESLKKRLTVIAELIPQGASVVYLDYPVHENIGDLLIMLGTEQFFRDYKIRVVYRASIKDFHRLPRKWLGADTVILCHGGGNLGDLYKPHQDLRERVIKKHIHNRIIMLPQTIHFSDPKQFALSAQIMRRHPDLHIFVRDEVSYRLARDNNIGDNVYLSPDMAHQLWPHLAVPDTGTYAARTLFLIRDDLEKNTVPDEVNAERAHFVDWGDLVGWGDRVAVKGFIWAHRLNGYMGNWFPIRKVWCTYVDALVGRATSLYRQHETVTTSRLHGHILACLMAKPSVLLDNSYGKNSAYFNAWTSRISTCRLISSASVGDKKENTS